MMPLPTKPSLRRVVCSPPHCVFGVGLHRGRRCRPAMLLSPLPLWPLTWRCGGGWGRRGVGGGGAVTAALGVNHDPSQWLPKLVHDKVPIYTPVLTEHDMSSFAAMYRKAAPCSPRARAPRSPLRQT